MSASASSLTLSLDALVRSIAVNRDSPHLFFLGAGASITSGVPSATHCIWQWKREIFLTNNPGLELQLGNVSLPSVQQKIQQWLDSEGNYPSLGAPEEYGFYVERCYPIGQDRRQYFQKLIEQANPYIGYQLLCLLAEVELVKQVWTTNFDGLILKAALAAKVTPIEIGLDTTERVIRQPRRGELLCIALHGDYRYDALKNTLDELQYQDKQLRTALIEHLRNSTLIVSGYSGRDESVMEALTEAYSQQGSGRLYWCGYTSAEPPPSIQQLLVTARTYGREAYYVSTGGFDDLLVRLAPHCLTGDLLLQAHELSSRVWTRSDIPPPPFAVDTSAVGTVIKSNAFPLDCPGEILQFTAQGFDTEGAWQKLREQIAGYPIVAGFQRGKILALGTTEGVKQALGDNVAGEIARSPIDDKELAYTDGVIVSLLTEALVRSIASTRSLQTDGRHQLWVAQSSSEVHVHGIACQVHQAVSLFLRRYGGKQYAVLKPTIKGTTKDGKALPEETEEELKRLLLTKQYNKAFNEAINRWRERLFPGNRDASYTFPPQSGSSFRFHLKSIPVFAKIMVPQAKPLPKLPPNVEHHIAHAGMQYREPVLLFSNRQGDGFVKDTHPLRGMVQNQPYDYALTRRGFSGTIRLGVICPAQDTQMVSRYLLGLHQRKQPDSKREYLLEYPGFGVSFGVPLDIPQPQDAAWLECPEPRVSLGTTDGATELGRQITNGIKALQASASPSLILIYIPERWHQWERYEAEGERYDLHDFVKAFCVQRGIPTQFLREATLSKPYQCEIMWWLALSCYVKAMRTPWVLESLDTNTAFMGLGFSLDRSAQRGEQVILGCSHIYNAEGLGLRYKLSKIENPIIRKGNPFMSRDDARRLGSSPKFAVKASLADNACYGSKRLQRE